MILSGQHLPTTGASWINRENLFVQQFDGAEVFNLGPVERGVKGASDKVHFRWHSTKRHAAKRKTERQLDREIAQSLASSGQPQLADLFADPAATKAFAREMRHEIQKKQTSEKTATTLAARPFTVRHLEAGRRALFGRYSTESEARATADRINGWIEHGGSVVYGRPPSDHAARRSK